ncbi:MAG TPA: presqualene diphosphate synthase HpnD [Stellaceae bacterium]|nr:presqualene diphosphate synthase HpnD [Stellaceae bacterium]
MTAPGEAASGDLMAEVTARVGAAKSSFFLAMRVLPAARRDAMFAIYAFCREVDDIADEPGSLVDKRAGLAQWRCDIDRIYDGGMPPTHLIARALVDPVQRFGLLRQDFYAVIDGMAMDAERDIVAPSAAELDLYCARVASAVGRLSVRVFGEWHARADDVADELGRALQLTNILRDLDEDAERGRLYLPREALTAAGIDISDPATVLANPALSLACNEVLGRARRHFAAAAAAMADCPKSSMRPAAMMFGIYRATLERLARRGWASPRRPVRVPTPIKLWIALRHGFL